MFRWAKGIYGTGLPRSTKGMLPMGRDPYDCVCDLDSFTAWEGHQIVASFHPPITTNVVSIKLVRQLAHYSYDIEDGELLYEDTGPFSTTSVLNDLIKEAVSASATAVFRSSLPADNVNGLSDLSNTNPLQPGTLSLDWESGGAPQNTTDDGAGGFVGMAGSSVDYCTQALVLDFTALPPDVGTDIELSYDTLDEVQVSTRLSGTISGGTASAGAGTLVALTDWVGIVVNNELSFAAQNYNVVGAADIYYISVDSDGTINHNNSIQTDETLLCRVETNGAAIIDGPYDMRLLLNMELDDDGAPYEVPTKNTDFWYYALFSYNLVTLAWDKCQTRDYSLTYDSTTLFEWLWNHLPSDWRTDDSSTLQQTLTELQIDDGQYININEDNGKLRGQLYRFLKWFGVELERGRAYIRAIALLYLDVDRAPPPVLQTLAYLVGIDIPTGWELMRQRYHVKGATLLWQRKGAEEAITIAVYRATGIFPDGIVEIHERLLYTNMYAGTVYTTSRTSLDTTLAGGRETLTDPHHYVYGPSRTRHYHERGLNIFIIDLLGILTQTYTQTLKLRIRAPITQPIYKTSAAVPTVNSLKPFNCDDYIVPGSLTVYWRSGAAPGVPKSMTDDGLGSFTGDGNPTESNIDYVTKKLVLDTRGDEPTINTQITVEYLSSSATFKRMKRIVRDAVAGTAHVAYYIDNALLGVSD